MALRKRKVIQVRSKRSGCSFISEALSYAIERGMNRHDKYHEVPLDQACRDLLMNEISNSFWIWFDENEVTIK